MHRIHAQPSRCLPRPVSLLATPVAAQQGSRISITTGGTGGVYYPLGGGMANVLSKYVPGLQATAEVTGGSVDNLKLIGAGKSEVGFSMVDAAWEAAQGQDKFKDAKVNARTLMVLYPNRMQIVTVDGTGITKLSDLKGKRVSTGAPGSGVEVMAHARARGSRHRSEEGHQAGAPGRRRIGQRDQGQKIDAFFWVGGVPTAAITDLAATPGTKMRLIDHAEALDAMNKKYGPLYVKGIIAPTSYSGMDKPVENIDVWNILVTSDKMSDQMAYDIVKTLMEKKPELVAVHKEAENIDLKYQKIGSPIAVSPGREEVLRGKGRQVLTHAVVQ